LARRDRNVFTIMVVPHAETKVFTFRVSTLAFQVICFGLVCLFLFMIIMVRSYQTMVGSMAELEELRMVNREQRAQIEQLAEETRALQQRMLLLDELDKQVREMMELQSSRSSKSSLGAAPAPPSLADVSAASMDGVGGPSLTGVGDGVVVGRRSIQVAKSALELLDAVSREMGERSKSLEEVRRAVSESTTYMASKPSIPPAFGYTTSRYGYRRTIFGSDFHSGYDIAAREGSPIVATADGTVVFAGWDGNYGNVVVVEHAYGWSTVYGHCAKVIVQVGDRVKRGEVIAFLGSTGRSTGPHVHYEVRVNGKTVNPYYYLGTR